MLIILLLAIYNKFITTNGLLIATSFMKQGNFCICQSTKRPSDTKDLSYKAALLRTAARYFPSRMENEENQIPNQANKSERCSQERLENPARHWTPGGCGLAYLAMLIRVP